MDIEAIVKHFGLTEHPFISSPDPRFLYFSSQVREVLAKCEFMARDRIGPIYMYGPIGSGKTSLVRRLHEKLSQDERYNVKEGLEGIPLGGHCGPLWGWTRNLCAPKGWFALSAQVERTGGSRATDRRELGKHPRCG